jgi:serine/threonine protein kinase
MKVVVPRIVGPYEIVDKLGSGGFGNVYKAVNLETDQIVAIKVSVKPRFVDKSSDLFHEHSIISKLNCENIIKDLGFGDCGSGLEYLAMEFCEGGSLQDRLDGGGKLRIDETMDIIRPIAHAIGYLCRVNQRSCCHVCNFVRIGLLTLILSLPM